MKRIIDKNLFFVKNKDFHTIVIRVVFPMYELENDLANSILFSPLVSFMNEAYDTEDKAQFYNYTRSLDALREAMKGGSKTILLDKDSEIAKILYGAALQDGN